MINQLYEWFILIVNWKFDNPYGAYLLVSCVFTCYVILVSQSVSLWLIEAKVFGVIVSSVCWFFGCLFYVLLYSLLLNMIWEVPFIATVSPFTPQRIIVASFVSIFLSFFIREVKPYKFPYKQLLKENKYLESIALVMIFPGLTQWVRSGGILRTTIVSFVLFTLGFIVGVIAPIVFFYKLESRKYVRP